jgi:hypothetical protein
MTKAAKINVAVSGNVTRVPLADLERLLFRIETHPGQDRIEAQ